MRMHGYCETCHKMRMVRVTPVRLGAHKVPVGICASCEDKKEKI